MGKFVVMSVLTVLFSLRISGVEPLKNVQIIVPSAVSLKDDVTLTCMYDLDHNETLYSVKWYLDADEFYRWIPKEVPAIQVFLKADMSVDKSKSDSHRVRLIAVSHEQTGMFKCEVSADAPFFDTGIVEAPMTVVEFPDNPPLIEVGKHRVEVGEKVRANCSFGPSKPAANITWFSNNLQVKDQFITENPVFEDGSKKVWVKSSLEMDTTGQSFHAGRLKLKCIATIFSVYNKVSEMQIEEEKPRSESVLGSKDSSGKIIGGEPNTPGAAKGTSVGKSSSSASTLLALLSTHPFLHSSLFAFSSTSAWIPMTVLFLLR